MCNWMWRLRCRLIFPQAAHFCHILTKAWPNPCLPHLSAHLWFTALAFGGVCQFAARSGSSLSHTNCIAHVQLHTDPFIRLVGLLDLIVLLFCVFFFFFRWVWRNSGLKRQGNVKEWNCLKRTYWSQCVHECGFKHTLCCVWEWVRKKERVYTCSYAFLSAPACLQCCLYPTGLVEYLQGFNFLRFPFSLFTLLLI